MMPTTGLDAATLIGVVYVIGLSILALVITLRGKRDEASGDVPVLLARFVGEQRFDPAMRANPDQFNK